MAGAKRQGREKPSKIEQRKVRGPEQGPQVAQTALRAGPIYKGQAHGGKKPIKRGAKTPGVSLSPSHLCISLVGCPHGSRMYFPLFSK